MNKWLSRIWEAPQKALAHVVKWISKAELLDMADMNGEGVHFYFWGHGGGMSLSNHIFLPKKHFDKTLAEVMNSKWHRDYMAHEYGHTVQSRRLGPLYLLVIGLPSIIWAGCFESYRKKHNISYYSFYTERFADKLGGVKRED
jgi:hypothetical protein